jgi:hypothetical protein
MPVQNRNLHDTRALIVILSQQEVILPGHKALVSDGVLYNDRVYETTGDIGRWAMNTFLRPAKTHARRESVYAHIDWLVTGLVNMFGLTGSDIQLHAIVEQQIGRLVQTLSSLMQVYSADDDVIEHPLSTDGDTIQAPSFLETCMIQLLDLQNMNNSIDIVDTHEVHV